MQLAVEIVVAHCEEVVSRFYPMIQKSQRGLLLPRTYRHLAAKYLTSTSASNRGQRKLPPYLNLGTTFQMTWKSASGEMAFLAPFSPLLNASSTFRSSSVMMAPSPIREGATDDEEEAKPFLPLVSCFAWLPAEESEGSWLRTRQNSWMLLKNGFMKTLCNDTVLQIEPKNNF